ncbi:transcription antitermination factor NusB [Okibacterium endophyticum]
MNPSPPQRAGGGRPSQTNAVQPARRVAYDVLAAVTHDDAYANLALPAAIRRAGLDTADAGLATELTYGTLRMQGYYDRVIAIASSRDLSTIDASVLDVLRLGAHQILSTRVAQHAAVNESVALAAQIASRSATGFTNGVLRAITRATPDEWRERVLDAAVNRDDRLSAEYSHPAWIVRALRRALAAEGRENELEKLLAADNEPAAVNLVALPGLAAAPDSAQPNRYAPTGFSVGRGDPDALVRPAEGRIRVQDEGSQLAALALSRTRPVTTPERWLDLCAGPGGKTALLAAEAASAGAELVANELIPARAALVRRAVGGLPLAVEVTESDGTMLPQAPDPRLSGRFDRILVDAPCTGLGALRRRPEARWRKQPADVPQLAALQRSLADAAFDALTPDGILAYVTCSPHVAETRAVLADALAGWGDRARLLDAARVLGDLTREPLDLGEPFQHNGEGTTVQLWPHRHGTDAMFISLVQRTS